MEVCVCISCVPETTYRIKVNPDENTLDYSNTQVILNPLDNYTLTKAIQLKADATNEIKSITLLTVGDQACDSVLKKAMAMGADHAIRVDIKPKDSFTTSQNISKLIENKKYDLVFMGKESIDYNSGSVPATTAALSNYQLAQNCIDIKITEQGSINITTDDIDSTTEIKMATPLIITGQKGLVQDDDIIIPNMRALMAARQKNIDIIKPEEIVPFTETVSYEVVEQQKETKYFTTDNLEELAEIIYTEYKNQ